jgi:hypothetical protein
MRNIIFLNLHQSLEEIFCFEQKFLNVCMCVWGGGEGPTCSALIGCAHSGLKRRFFFHLGLQNKFPGKNKNMEWQRENMANYSIVKSFDPIK